MNTFKCAFRYFTRKKIRSIILVLILCVLSVLILTVFSITTAARAHLDQLEANFSREFTINARMSPGTLTLENIKKLVQRDDITAYRYISNQSPVCFTDEDGVPLQVKTEGEHCLTSPGFEHAGTLMSHLNSELDDAFKGGVLKLSSGRHLTEQDTQAILIHQEFAVRNNLNIGDKIQLDFSSSIRNDLKDQAYNIDGLTQQKVIFEITGIFQTSENNRSPANSSGMYLSHQLYENYCYIDFNTYADIFSEKSGYFNEAAFSISASADLATVVAEIKQLNWIDWTLCSVHSDLDDYSSSLGALTALSNYLRGSLILIVPIAFFLLYLVLSNGVKQRKHEIAVFLVLGISKSRILFQHIIEVFLAAVCAFVLAIMMSGVIIEQTGHHLLKNSVNSDPSGLAEANETSDSELIKTNDMGKIKIKIHPEAIGYMSLIEAILIPLSVTAAGYMIVKKRPNEILKSLS